jgi:hypothetical protein
METKLNSQENRYLAFSLGAENYAIPLLLVKEVVALPKIRALPQTPAHFLGLMDLRGQVMPVIDLRLKLNIKPSTSLETSVIICDLQSVCIAMVAAPFGDLRAAFGRRGEAPGIHHRCLPQRFEFDSLLRPDKTLEARRANSRKGHSSPSRLGHF